MEERTIQAEDKKVIVTILINQKPFHLQQNTITSDEIRNLVNAPLDYEVWKIIKDPDPEGELPKDDIQIKGTIEIRSGDRFRVVPPGTFGEKIL